MDTSHAEMSPEDESSWSWETSSPGDADWEDTSHDSQGDEVHDVSAIGKDGKGKRKRSQVRRQRTALDPSSHHQQVGSTVGGARKITGADR